jgi:hypothetical protein
MDEAREAQVGYGEKLERSGAGPVPQPPSLMSNAGWNPARVLGLQRAVGNRATSRILTRAKLRRAALSRSTDDGLASSASPPDLGRAFDGVPPPRETPGGNIQAAVATTPALTAVRASMSTSGRRRLLRQADRSSELAGRQKALEELFEFKRKPPAAREVSPDTGVPARFIAEYLPNKNVLMVTVRCQFTFKSGESELFWILRSGKKVPAEGSPFDPSDPITDAKRDKLIWDKPKQDEWKRRYLELCSKAWTDPGFTFFCHKDWWEELTARTVVKFEEATDGQQSVTPVEVTAGSGAAEKEFTKMGVCHIFEDAILPGKFGQITAIHESGHMLGLGDEYKTGETRVAAAHSKLVQEEFGHEVIEGEEDHTSIMSSGAGTHILPEHGVVFLAGLRKLTAGTISPTEWHVTPKPNLPGRHEAVTPKETLDVTSGAHKKSE